LQPIHTLSVRSLYALCTLSVRSVYVHACKRVVSGALEHSVLNIASITAKKFTTQ